MRYFLLITLTCMSGISPVWSAESLTERRANAIKEIPPQSPQRDILVTTHSLTGDVGISLGFKPPLSYYNYDGSALAWNQPQKTDSACLFITIKDKSTNREIAGCSVNGTITNGHGKPEGTSVTLAETWDPQFNFYGSNISYNDLQTTAKIALTITPPKTRRTGESWGSFFSSPVKVVFDNIPLPKTDTKSLQINEATKKPQGTAAGTTTPIWPEGRRPFLSPTPYPGSF